METEESLTMLANDEMDRQQDMQTSRRCFHHHPPCHMTGGSRRNNRRPFIA